MELKAKGGKINKKFQIIPTRFLYKVVEHKSSQMSTSHV